MVLIISIIIVIFFSIYIPLLFVTSSFHTEDGRGNCRNMSVVKLRSVVFFIKQKIKNNNKRKKASKFLLEY